MRDRVGGEDREGRRERDSRNDVVYVLFVLLTIARGRA